MKKVRVPLYGSPQKSVTVNADATDGATVGVNLWNRDGTLFIPAAAGDGGSEVARTVWRLVLEIPANVKALAATTGTGLYAITSDGASATRSITSATLDVANGDGVAGDPVVDLPELPNAGVGTLQKTQRDQYGRLAGTSDATTDDLTEGGNLYFTDTRADARVDAGIAEHVAQTDPHRQYTTADEAATAADARIAAAKADPDGIASLSGGKLDAGQLPANIASWAGIAPSTKADTSALAGYYPITGGTVQGNIILDNGTSTAVQGWNSGGVRGGGFRVNAASLVLSAEGRMIYLRPNGDATSTAQSTIATSGIFTFGADIRPASDNSATNGASGARWSVVYAATGTINTSDAREKSNIRDLTPVELAAASDLAALPRIYQWNDAIAAKGDDARLHCSPTVQSVIAIMESHGLDPFRYGFVCFDEWDEAPEIRDEETGEITDEYRPAGDRYSLRPSELESFIAAGMAHRIAQLEARLAALESE